MVTPGIVRPNESPCSSLARFGPSTPKSVGPILLRQDQTETGCPTPASSEAIPHAANSEESANRWKSRVISNFRPSRWAVGTVLKPDGTIGTYAGGTLTLLGGQTTYIYLNSTLTLQSSTSAWPATQHTRLAVVTTNASTVTGITDSRVMLEPCLALALQLTGGTLVDAANVAVGTNTGTQIATNATQKLGFFGATPVVQQTLGANTATNSWTNTERNMLQLLYNAFRTLGLGS
jgi:hypothetical protein